MITNRNSSLILLTGGHRTTNFRNCYYLLIDSIWMFLRLSLNMSFSQYCLFQQYISKLRQIVAMLIFCTWESNVVHLFRSLLIHKPLFSYDNLEEFLSHTAQKMKFSMKDFFSHIYRRNPSWKTSFFCAVPGCAGFFRYGEICLPASSVRQQKSPRTVSS